MVQLPRVAPVPPTPGKVSKGSPGASGDPQGLAVLGLKDKAKKWAWGARGVGLISMLITNIKWPLKILF